MEVSFSLEPNDLRALQRTGSRYGRIGCFLFLLLLVVSFIVYWVEEGSIGAEVVFLIIAWAVFFLTPWQEGRQIRKAFDRHRDLLTNQHIRLTPDELISSNDVGIGATRWEAVRKILQTDGHVFIFTSDTGALVVPRRAFADQQAFREFVDEAKTYRARALASRRSETKS